MVRHLTTAWRTSSPRQAMFQALADIISDSIAPWI
ncbi:hypothetical protein ABAC402_16305 [Asticcacaulis sp. AC402]|nr:hypothetical protein ABAC402_16305 [Asticcacaulis sp. AC402]